MSLAEKTNQSDMQVRPLHPAGTHQLDNILRLALNGAAKPGVERRSGEVDFSKAATLLDRATTAIQHLTARRDELEEAAAAREEFYAEKLRQLQEHASEWERRAKVIKAQLHDCESRMAEQQNRLETMTYRAETAESRAQLAEQQAADARNHLQMYHDKIVDTFGALV